MMGTKSNVCVTLLYELCVAGSKSIAQIALVHQKIKPIFSTNI